VVCRVGGVGGHFGPAIAGSRGKRRGVLHWHNSAVRSRLVAYNRRHEIVEDVFQSGPVIDGSEGVGAGVG